MALVALSVVVACTSPPQSSTPTSDPVSNRLPALGPGAPVQLDPARATSAIAAIAAAAGELRVLYQREESHEVRYAVLTAAGGVTRNQAIPASLVPPKSFLQPRFALDLAFDSDAVLHALVGSRHLVLHDDVWRSESGPPCEAFVRGGPRLACVGPPSADFPARYQWDVFIAGSALLPIIVPTRTKLRSLAVYVQQPDGWHAQGVFDAASEQGTSAFKGVASADGDVHAVFARNDRYSFNWRYERAPGVASSAAPVASAPVTARPPSSGDSTKDANCIPPPGLGEWAGAWPLNALAIDQATGEGIVTIISYRAGLVCQRAIDAGTLGDPHVAFSGRVFTGVWIASLGGARFGVLLADLASNTASGSELARFSFADSGPGTWSGAQSVGDFRWATSFGGDAPLVGGVGGHAALVALDREARPVVVWFAPRP